MALPTVSSARDSQRFGVVSCFCQGSTGATPCFGLVSATCIDFVLIPPSWWLPGRKFARSSESACVAERKSSGQHDERAANDQPDRSDPPSEDLRRARRYAAESQVEREFGPFGSGGNLPQSGGLRVHGLEERAENESRSEEVADD